MRSRTVRIGAGCSVDTTLAWPQMARHGQLDYFIVDYLYEAGVAAYAAERSSDPRTGFPAEFTGAELAPWMAQLLKQKIRIITNAGALNPLVCAQALRVCMNEHGLTPRIAVVHGDDVRHVVTPEDSDMYTGEPLPQRLASANAYLGARPIAQALAQGADIVVTGRVVDSALIVGPLMHEFGWAWDDYQNLGNATLVGHLLECGPQPSGGISTDWREVDFSDMSFPIAECFDDGTAVITKVPGTGGRVSVGTCAEQILYEIGDPQRYFMPDVTCDFSEVKLEQIGPDRVRVSGARGYAPTTTYKTCCMEQQGWRGVASGVLAGPHALEKGRKTAEAIVLRAQRLATEAGLGEFIGHSIELIGSGQSQGARGQACDLREIVYRVVMDHRDQRAVEPLPRVARAAGVSMAPGTGGLLGASVTPLMRMYSVLLEKSKVRPMLTLDDDTRTVEVAVSGGFDSVSLPSSTPLVAPVPAQDPVRTVPLERLAWTRSGDKGNLSNIGVIARKAEYLPYLKAALTPRAVGQWFNHLYDGDASRARVDVYELAGLNALNFLLHDALAGGAVASRRFDTMGKGLGQQIIDFPVPVPIGLLD